MILNEIVVPASDVMKNMTFTVRLTGTRVLAVRVRVGLLLMRLAAWVIGVGIHVELERDEFEHRDRRQEP